MLISKKDIKKINPPFLLVSATGNWALVSNVTETYGCFKLEVVESKNEDFNTRFINLYAEPFYVGADIWELEYGSVLMTLNHESLHDHPAQILWEQWNVSMNKV